MLEGPLKTWICHFLGQYVESETVQVSTKLWTSSERLKLENLTLKKSVIPAWLPFRLKTGFVGQFEADLPISAIFGSGSAKIKFSDVLLVLAPLRHDEAEERDEIESLVDQKLQHLEQDLLDRWEGPHVPEYTVPHESEGYFGVDGWLGRTITKLIDNLQIDVRNLHIRIEGVWFPLPSSPLATAAPPRSRGSSPTMGPSSGTPSISPPPSTTSGGIKFAAGVSLSALSAVTTPSNWRIDGFDDGKATASEDQAHLVFKLINALDLSAYVDPNALHFIHSSVHPKVLQSTLSRLQEMNKVKNARSDWWNAEENVHTHRFLVTPIAVALKLTMNTAAQHAQTNDPRYNAAFHLSKMAVALDEEQLSVLNLIIDSYCRHEEWRVKVSEQLKSDERAAVRGNEKMGTIVEEYVALWKQLEDLKQGGLDHAKTTPVWKTLTNLERGLPCELVVSLRNRGSTEPMEESGERMSFSSLFHEMGDAMGIPLPEISVQFAEGPTGLVLDISKSNDVVVVSRSEQGQAAKKEAVKPGLIVVAVDGKPLKSVVRCKSALEVQAHLDKMPGTRSITFRHPLVMAPEVTPQRLVSKVVFTSDDLSFRLVRASKKIVLAKLVLERPLVMIRGYGPDLFSFHQYEVRVHDFYLQNSSWDPSGTSYCIASSVASPHNGNGKADHAVSFRLGMDYLYDAHPDAVPGKVSTYGSKISLHIGDSVLVVDDDKMASLMTDWFEFGAAVSSQYTDIPAPSQSDDTRYGTGETVSLTSSGLTVVSNNTGGDDLGNLVPPRTVSSYSYDFKIDQIMIFVSAASKSVPPASATSQPSYRSLLKQLVNKESSTVHVVAPDWQRATQAIVLIQRFLRGAVVRKRQLVRIGLTRSRWMQFQGEERMGWLYSRDDTLAFKRWRRAWCHLDEDGVFSIHTDGSGAELLDEFKVRRCNVTLVPNATKGPWGLRRTCHLLEVRSAATGVLRKVLSSDVLAEVEAWRTCIELSARNASKRKQLRGKDRADSAMTADSSDTQDLEEVEPEDAAPQQPPVYTYEEPRYSAAVAESFLMGGFSDSYESSIDLHAAKSKWISINGTDLHFMTDVHRVSEPEQSAFHVYTGVQFLSVLDHRKKTNHGLLHIGDEFLGLKNGVLTPTRIRADRVKGGPFLALSLSYRGAQVAATTFDSEEGLHVDLDISGWCLPLNLYEVIFEVLDVISVFWTDPTMVPDNQDFANASTDPWYRVTALGLHIRAPIVEAYLEDSHCVAKLSLENSVFGYKADQFCESAKIHLGPTALFVLTDEVALRLAQVEKCRINYEMKMNRYVFGSDTQQQSKCELCHDENAKRAACHRSVTMTLGQIKLEADRRLELLFALVEALTGTEETPPPPATTASFGDDEFIRFRDDLEEEKSMDALQPVRPFSSTFDVAPLTIDCLPTERLQAMQQLMHFDDPDLRPMYSQFGRQFSAGPLGSPSGLSRISSATTAHNWQSQDENAPYDRTGPRPPRSQPVAWIPLLNYQAYIGILPPEEPSRTRTLFRLRLRSGRIHDHISLSCSSIVFEVIKRSLSVVALDTYIPVMNFSIGDMKVLAMTRTEFTKDATVDASVEMSARYYNSTLADWEPFIEPWRAYARVKSDDGENGTSVQLSAMQRLNVNITDALVRLLSSVAKNRKKQVMFVEKRTPAAVAADGEAKKEDGRVCVLNNLGAPIRLANLNTSQPGTLYVEVRDGWSYPAYTRFHDVRVQVVLLPWWHPREAKRVESVRHKFSLPYGGAQSGVTPILRVDVSTFGTGKRNFVFDQVAKRYVEVEGEDGENDADAATLTHHRSIPSLSRLAREETSGSTLRPRWCSIGSAEINLVGSVMGSLGSRGTKLSRWYRLRDERGNVTGEIFVALDFVPFSKTTSGQSDGVHSASEPDQVRDGQFLVFDPLKTLAAKELKPSSSLSSALSRRSNRSRPPSSKHIVLSHGLRASYVPPLALEVMLGSTRCSLLCPLRRAGKFLIQGDKVLAEVKVAQRDESRRVLLLSSPVQLKNATSIDIELWSCPTNVAVGESGVFNDALRLSIVSTGSKLSVPLSAIYGDSQHSVIVKVDGSKPTVVANLGELAAGTSLIILDPEDGHVSGFCLFVSTTAYMRKVYREEHQEIVSRGVGVAGTEANPSTSSPPVSQSASQSYATKYQIGLHACLVFENTLPVRVQYKVVIPRSELDPHELVLRTGTLSPGEDVNLYEFHSFASLLLRLPEMDSIWCKPIDLGDCMYREGMGREVKAMLNASGFWSPTVEFLPSLQSTGIAFKEEDLEARKVIARLDYTTADDGSPRVVLYTSLWVYNQSHVAALQFRCADDGYHSPTIAVPQVIPQRPIPRLMDCPQQTFEISTVIDHEVSRWSEKIHATVVGIQAPIPLKFGSSLGPKMRHEIGISIQRPLGQFHRTTQVIVMPRFVVVNKTAVAFKVSPHGKDSDHVVEIPAANERSHSSVPFDFDVGSSPLQRLLFVRMDHAGAEWSGPFAVDEEKEFPLKLQGNVESNWKRSDAEEVARRYGRGGDFVRSASKLFRVKVRIHTVGPTMVVSLMRDDPAMFVIRNESSWDLYVNQQHASEEALVVRTKEFVPFAWTKPEGSRRVSCRVGVPGHTHPKGFGSRVYDFNNLDRDRGIDDLRFWLFGNQLRRIQADISVEESSRVLVFRDHNTERPSSYVLEVKVIAARFFHELSMVEDPTAEIVLETDNQNGQTIAVESKDLRTAHVYRFDTDSEFASEARPKRLTLSLFQNHRVVTRENDVASIGIDDDSFLHTQLETNQPASPTGGGDEFGAYEMLQTPSGSPLGSSRLARRQAFRSAAPDSGSFHEAPLHLDDAERVSNSDVSSDRSEMAEHADDGGQRSPSGVVEIKLPRKAWSKFGVGTRRSITWSYNNMPHALYSLGRVDGHWWEMRDPVSGELVGEVQVALKFRTSVREYTHPAAVFNVSVQVPSVGFSFLHTASSSLVDVAYLSLQRLALVYSCVGDSSEIACSLGNLQMDNQMDSEVVLGPKVHHMKEGVSVRLRDRWRAFRDYSYRGISEQLDTGNTSFLQFRTLWNSRCTAGDITHYELVEFSMQEVEISTDEKFVVNLITVFQGLGTLTSQHTFEDIVDTYVEYGTSSSSSVAMTEGGGAVVDGVYIEALHIDAIRVKFSMELNGGRHIKTLGPSGRRLAVYLPESNVKDFRLYFSQATYAHLYETKSNVVEKITRRYQQQAVILVLRGLYTVSVYANPFRIAYRLGHGVLEVFRLPARGLASGSPVELISGAYLGVRSLAMNTISAGYEIVAGASGIVAALLSPLLPESRRRAFEDEMLGFQRAVIEEVDSFDAAEERTMTKLIVRKPRVFDPHGVGLLTVYGPGSVPLEEQDRIDYRAAVLLQQWWRRHRRANKLWAEALRLRPDLEQRDESSSRCAVM